MAGPASFVWRGRDRLGRATGGEVAGVSAAAVRANLGRRGIRATSVRRKRADGGIGTRAWFRRRGVRPRDVTVFARQLAAMTRAGVPVVQAFDIVAEGAERAALGDLVRSVRADVSAGESLASALGRRTTYFDDLFCNLVDAGERSGALPEMLDRVATYREKSEALRAKVRKAMTYPAAVLCVAAVVSGILLVKVVPQFEQIFAGFGAELPASTRMVIALSDFVQARWMTMLASVAGLFLGLRAARRRSMALRDFLDAASLRLPIVGRIARQSAVARCTRTLSTTFAAGVPLVDALESAAGVAGNAVFVRAVRRVRDDVATGRALHASMREAGVFPDGVLGMVAVGEESGTLDDMLDRSAGWYEEQVDDAVDQMAALVEPVIMAVLGVLVGGLILAMYLPIFQLGAVIGAH